MNGEELLKKLYEAVVDGNPKEARRMAQEALDMGVPPTEGIANAITPALAEVGDLFASGALYLPELMASGKAALAGVDVLETKLLASGSGRQALGTILIGTVAGDIHSIGKEIVSALLRANGFEVIDLGTDVPDEQFVQQVEELKPDILALSALLTTTTTKQRDVIVKLREAGLRDKVKVIVGGAPVTAEWAERIGADGTAPEAVAAVALGKRLLGIRSEQNEALIT